MSIIEIRNGKAVRINAKKVCAMIGEGYFVSDSINQVVILEHATLESITISFTNFSAVLNAANSAWEELMNNYEEFTPLEEKRFLEGYEKKFAEFIQSCEDRQKQKEEDAQLNYIVITEPTRLGDNYREIIESLKRITKCGLLLVSVLGCDVNLPMKEQQNLLRQWIAKGRKNEKP